MSEDATNSATIDRLKSHLSHSDDSIRYNAALDLAKLGDASGALVLIEAFKHESSALRIFHTSRALVGLGAQVVPALTAALEAEHDQIRVDAAYTLYQIDRNRLPNLLPLVLQALHYPTQAATQDAIYFLGEVDSDLQAIVPALIEALHAEHQPEDIHAWPLDPRVSIAALLAKIGEPAHEIVAALRAALDSPAPAVRWAASLALGSFGAEATEAIGPLTALAQDENEVETIRVQAAYAIAAIADPITESVPLLKDALSSSDWWVRAFAARILREMLAPEERALTNENFGWRDNFFAGQRHVRHLSDPSAVVPILSQALADSDFNVRRNVCLALAEIGERASAAIPALVEGLGHDDTGPVVAETLARIGDQAVPALATVLASGAEPIRALARYALQQLGTPLAQEAEQQAEVAGESFTPLPEHFFHQLPWTLDDQKVSAFEKLYDDTLAAGQGRIVSYNLPYPRHEFLRYLVEKKGLLLHGSARTDLKVLKPLRTSIDGADSGNVSGIYADKDAIRPIYFAVVNRQRCFGLNNGFFDVTPDNEVVVGGEGPADNRFYRLAIGVNGLRRDPWMTGMVYALPPETFNLWNEWTSRELVYPVMKIPVAPDDLPLKEHLVGSDWRDLKNTWIDPREPFPFLREVQGTPICCGGPAWKARPSTR